MANKEFYRYAKAYDIAFSGRDYQEECDFMEWCFNEHKGFQPSSDRSFLELACGPAHHAREMARRGWNSTALDLSKEMIDYAKELSSKEKLKMNYLTSDMIDFKLDEPVDLIGNFTESITHITTNEDFLLHLKSVSANLKSGGVYVIETGHPLYFFPESEPNLWSVKNGTMAVDILFGSPDDKYDSIKQQWTITTKMTIKLNGVVTDVVESKSLHRWYLVQELRALIELSGEFDEYWFYGNMEIPAGELDDSENSDCMIVVMRKK